MTHHEIVARTLEQLACWQDDDRSPENLRQLAREVRGEDPPDMCCPMCQEVDCDSTCPLAAARADLVAR
jgi:hypothetical protein